MRPTGILRVAAAVAALLTLSWCVEAIEAAPVASAPVASNPATPSEPFLLGPPPQDGPVPVRARFVLQEINEIDDGLETFDFRGVLTLRWRDPRQAFDPIVAQAQEKVFQGDFQFNEMSPSWYPQLVLVNQSGSYETDGVVLRVLPDGTSTLVQTINAVAEVDLDMRRFPFDEHRLEAVFEILGFDRDEVALEIESDGVLADDTTIRIPQWSLMNAGLSTRDRTAFYAGRTGIASAVVLGVEVQRNSWYVRRLVVFPLSVIVVLSFCVFWMDRSSLGDRVSVSFIGILTAVSYQLVTSEQLPHIAYVTLTHLFLGWSFVVMCSTVVINLVVGALDRQGRIELGDRVDYHSRWVFPVVYFAPILTLVATYLW